jgi:hypothetical protein
MLRDFSLLLLSKLLWVLLAWLDSELISLVSVLVNRLNVLAMGLNVLYG